MAKTPTPAAGIASVFDRMTHRSTPAPATPQSTTAARTATARTKRTPKRITPRTTTSSTPAADTTAPRTGRPRRYTERMNPTPVVLGTPHVAFLDNLRTTIGSRTHRAVSRSEIIRAMIDAVAGSSIDLAIADNEEQLCAILSARLTR